MHTAREQYKRTHNGIDKDKWQRNEKHYAAVIAELKGQQIYYDSKLRQVAAHYQQEESGNHHSVSLARRQSGELYSGVELFDLCNSRLSPYRAQSHLVSRRRGKDLVTIV